MEPTTNLRTTGERIDADLDTHPVFHTAEPHTIYWWCRRTNSTYTVTRNHLNRLVRTGKMIRSTWGNTYRYRLARAAVPQTPIAAPPTPSLADSLS